MKPSTEQRGPRPHVVAWESTRACNLACVHCRASAQTEPAPDELTTAEIEGVIDDIAAFAAPIFIISGGEPLMRADILHVARYGRERGLRVVMSPNGTLITDRVAQEMSAAGIARISVSIDGSCAARHDEVRGVPGAFDAAMQGLAACRANGIGFQLNTTVLRQTMDDLPAVHQLAVRLRSEAWHVFMLVPTGRARADDEITPEQYEEVLTWVYETARTSPVPIRVTCGPQFMRIVASRRKEDGPLPGLVRPDHGGSQDAHGHLDAASRGCLAGNGYCFISHRGEVFPCGYLPLLAGDVRQRSFREIYQQSELFQTLRDLTRLEGKCGVCEFVRVCGGCRARAYSTTGNVLAAEPLCTYQPQAWGQAHAG
jgi:heme b synthase